MLTELLISCNFCIMSNYVCFKCLTLKHFRNREKVFTVRLGDYVELLCPDLSDVQKITVYRVNKDQYDNCEVSQGMFK